MALLAGSTSLAGWWAASRERRHHDHRSPGRCRTALSIAAALPTAAADAADAPRLDPSTGRLQQVQIVFRHGARTPLTEQPYLVLGHQWGPDICGTAYQGGARLKLVDRQGNAPPMSAVDEAQQKCILAGGGCHRGELTLLGQRQALDMGRWLRERYSDGMQFLPAAYHPGLLSCHTTKYSRTRATLRGVLTGLYPDLGDHNPVPVVSSSDIDQILYADSTHCPHLGLLMEASAAKLAARDKAGQHERAELQAAVEAALPLPAGFWDTKWSWTEIHDALTSLLAHGKSIPPSLTPEIRRQINLLATRQFAAYLCPSLDDEHGHAMLRLSMGRLFDHVIDNMKRAAGCGAAAAAAAAEAGDESAPKMYFFSGHDSTVLPILIAMGIDVERTGWPPYLSNVCIELWELNPPAAGGPAAYPTTDGGRFAVRVLFNREEVRLPDCPPGRLMGLASFEKELLGGFILSEQDHTEACRVPLDHDTPLPHAVVEAAAAGGDSKQAAVSGSGGFGYPPPHPKQPPSKT